MQLLSRRASGLLLAGAMSVAAWQATAQTPSPICQDDERFHQFDFWIGEWNVTNSTNGNVAGENSIQPAENGCVLLEHWKGSGGGTGQSINYYDPIKDEWRQVWIANGSSIDYTGGLDENGDMVLEGELHNYRRNASFPFRGRWTPNEDGSVRQLFEIYNPKTEEWQVWFDGHYVRKEAGDSKDGG